MTTSPLRDGSVVRTSSDAIRESIIQQRLRLATSSRSFCSSNVLLHTQSGTGNQRQTDRGTGTHTHTHTHTHTLVISKNALKTTKRQRINTHTHARTDKHTHTHTYTHTPETIRRPRKSDSRFIIGYRTTNYLLQFTHCCAFSRGEHLTGWTFLAR